MSENIYQLQQIAQIYRNASLINQNRAFSNRQEAEKFANSAIENPEYKNDCLIQAQQYLDIATECEQLAARQLQYAEICDTPVNGYHHNIRYGLIDLLNSSF